MSRIFTQINQHITLFEMSLSNKLAITDVELKDKRVLIRVSDFSPYPILP